MNLDMQTLFVVVTSVALLLSFWVAFMAWGQPARHPLWAWALALLFYAVSQVLFGMRDAIPLSVVAIFGNTAYAIAFVLMLLALRRFQGVEMSGLRWLLPAVLVFVLAAFWLEQARWRVMAVTLVFCGQIGVILQALLDRSQRQHGRGRYILVGAFMALLLILLLRVGSAASGAIEGSSGVSSSPWLGLIFLVSMCVILSITLGFVYMTVERAERLNFEMAMKDMLTGLANRRAITDQLLNTVARAQRQGQYLSVLMLDIDHFKRVNDGYGHQAGDTVLRGVAQTLQSRLRAQDQIGRFGGEEFMVILPDTSLDGALTLAEALRQAVEATPTQWGAHSIAVTISIGVRGGAITGGDTADSLVGSADAALYRAKQNGRNRVEVALPQPAMPAGS
jgi:diguanylate cyclase (GGDEF)-like protein